MQTYKQHLTPWKRYQERVDAAIWDHCDEQANVMHALQAFYESFIKYRSKLRLPLIPYKTLNGIYIWGDVGVGKTAMMDLLQASLHEYSVVRTHFHIFMKNIQDELTKNQGKKNPLDIIIKTLSKTCDVLLFDEFVVYNIADAMILSRVLEALDKYHIPVVATSNAEPDNLYHKGLQRERFLPTIAWLKTHNHVIHIDKVEDYRAPGGRLPHAHEHFYDHFLHEHADDLKWDQTLNVNDRPIRVKAVGDGLLWITFENLCQIPRATSDYLKLAADYSKIFLSDFPVKTNNEALIRNFINFIDIAYENHTEVILPHNFDETRLYTGKLLQFEFKRALSRLKTFLRA